MSDEIIEKDVEVKKEQCTITSLVEYPLVFNLLKYPVEDGFSKFYGLYLHPKETSSVLNTGDLTTEVQKAESKKLVKINLL